MKIKKNLKGMTLYEMIIAIAIFAIMTGILVGVGNHIDKTNRTTRNLKSRIVRESPYAANKIKGDAATGKLFKADDMKIVVDFSDDTINKLKIVDTVIYDPDDPNADEDGKVSLKINYETDFTPLEMDAKKYETADSFLSEEADDETAKNIYGGLNLEFVEIEPE